MNPNYVTIVKQDLDKLLNVTFISLIKEVIWLSIIFIVQKTMTSLKFAWIFYDSMLQPRKIHILYFLLKRFWTK